MAHRIAAYIVAIVFALLGMSQVSAAVNGLSAIYFDKLDFSATASSIQVYRVDPTINFNWGAGSPDPTLGIDTFSAIWTGQVLAPVGGVYTFTLTGDDGVRLWVGGKELVGAVGWKDQAPTSYSGVITLTAGKRYDILVYYYDNVSTTAQVKLEWTRPGAAIEVIPETYLYSHGNYVQPKMFVELAFGTRSFYLHGWRGYLETRPAKTLLNGLGIHFNYRNELDPYVGLVAQHMAENAVTQTRFEIAWNSFEYDTPMIMKAAKNTENAAKLLALRANGIRPIIALNANDGGPCPSKTLTKSVPGGASVGATQITLNNVTDIIAGYTGIDEFVTAGGGTDAYRFITTINGNTVTLSQPLATAISAGATINLTTLKYRPFFIPGDTDHEATLAAWKNYVLAVGQYITGVFGTTGQADAGFDLEVWNELSFGSRFLNRNHYYNPDLPGTYNSGVVHAAVVEATAEMVRNNPTIFGGVNIEDGFQNTIPWRATSLQPLEVVATGSHPYPGDRKFFPAEDDPSKVHFDAQYNVTTFVPTFDSWYPEYKLSGLSGDGNNAISDMSPIPQMIGSNLTGRFARATKPVAKWMTEIGADPASGVDDPGTLTSERSLYLKGKITGRLLSFCLNKGVDRITISAVDKEGENTMSQFSDAFINYVLANGTYPTGQTLEDATSPAMKIFLRLAANMSDGLDPALSVMRAVVLDNVTDTHNNIQFTGNGTAANPDLFNRDVFTFLPFQVSASKFVIPYYVMTKDLDADLTPENYTLDIRGVDKNIAQVSVYDPINDASVPVTVLSGDADSIQLQVTATDYPYLLIIEEVLPPPTTTVTFTSVAAHDGYVVESSETSNVGGTVSSTATNTSALRAGDDGSDRQLKTFVSFDTSSLPDGATIVSATLKLKRGTVSGTNPFTTHGTCRVDIKSGSGFSGSLSLVSGDFEAPASAGQVATLSDAPANGDLSTGSLNATGLGLVNKTGHTQFRVYFSTDDNDDSGNDYIGWYSGDNGTSANRPVLEIVYY